jgi:pectate lyase
MNSNPALVAAVFSLLASAAFAEPVAPAAERAFPGAEGWAATTPGGRGGKIIRVTTLAATGPGSFLEALNARSPRIIVFEVGGVIDLDKQKIVIKEPFLTIAGQTAPSPGITIIRNNIFIQTHDVVIRHIRVRPGEAGHAKKSGWDADGISASKGSRDLIVDHCSFSWATDENLDIWGDPFTGSTPEEWHANNVQRITFSSNIIAEGLNDSTNTKGPHSKGMLVGDNTSFILVLGNLFADNVERNPEVKGGVWTAVVNNYIYNPAVTSVLYHMTEKRWKGHEYIHGRLELAGNVMRHGPDTLKQLTLFRFVGVGDLELHEEDNLTFDRDGKAMANVTEDNRYGGRILRQKDRVFWPEGLKPLPASGVQERVLGDAGARPWDRDAIDQRIIRQTREGTGRVINCEAEGGGYPVAGETRQPFDPGEWDLNTMERRK